MGFRFRRWNEWTRRVFAVRWVEKLNLCMCIEDNMMVVYAFL